VPPYMPPWTWTEVPRSSIVCTSASRLRTIASWRVAGVDIDVWRDEEKEGNVLVFGFRGTGVWGRGRCGRGRG